MYNIKVHPLRRTLREMIRDRRGVMTIEFALSLVLFLAVFLMAFEVCRVQVATVILERCVADIAYQSRLACGRNFSSIARSVLNRRNFMLFSISDVKIAARYAEDFADLIGGGGRSGSGRGGDAVRMTLKADLTILKEIIDNPWTVEREIVYYYRNEEDDEDIEDEEEADAGADGK
jgi:hypothetical protein